MPNTIELTFTPTTSQVTVTVIINNDDIVEDPEQFTAVLNADAAGLPVVTAPEVAIVTITEDTDDPTDRNTTDSKEWCSTIISTVEVVALGRDTLGTSRHFRVLKCTDLSLQECPE